VDKAWEQKKPEAKKKLKKRAESHLSAARIVGRRYRDELDYKEHDSGKHLRQ
jgi:hypothetical protein